MRLTPLSPAGSDVARQIERAISAELPGASVQVRAAQPGHFQIQVTSAEFQGKSRLECQRRVYKAIAELMRGDQAPVHAIDRLETSAG